MNIILKNKKFINLNIENSNFSNINDLDTQKIYLLKKIELKYLKKRRI